MSVKEPEPGFAGRWSRLKQEARGDVPADVPPQDAQTGDIPAEADLGPSEQYDTRSDVEILEDLGLPDPDSLEPGDDFKGFMSKAVPTRLRNRALRKLWLTNPVLANLDELLDYGDDFTDAATVIENLQTAYQVGRGFADKIIETPKPLLDPKDEPEDDAGEGPDEPDETESDTLAATEDSATVAPESDEAAAAFGAAPAEGAKLSDPGPEITARRRMRFRVAEE